MTREGLNYKIELTEELRQTESLLENAKARPISFVVAQACTQYWPHYDAYAGILQTPIWVRTAKAGYEMP